VIEGGDQRADLPKPTRLALRAHRRPYRPLDTRYLRGMSSTLFSKLVSEAAASFSQSVSAGRRGVGDADAAVSVADNTGTLQTRDPRGRALREELQR
jgi:hypothetical protein